MDRVLLFVHVVSAAVWLGADFAQFVLAPRFFRAPPATAAAWHRGTVQMMRVLYTPAAILILATGIVMVLRSPAYELTDGFVSIGLAVVIIGAVLGMAVFGPQGRRAASLHEEGASAQAVERRIAGLGALDALILLVAFAAMIGRWGAG